MRNLNETNRTSLQHRGPRSKRSWVHLTALVHLLVWVFWMSLAFGLVLKSLSSGVHGVGL